MSDNIKLIASPKHTQTLIQANYMKTNGNDRKSTEKNLILPYISMIHKLADSAPSGFKKSKKHCR